MRVLVAGASGFIGVHVVSEAVARGHEVLAVCHRRNKRTKDLEAIAKVVYSEFLEQPPSNEADATIYVAGSSRHARSLAAPESDLRVNTEAALRFLKELSGGVVLLSSAAVYHGSIGEVSPRTPIHPSFPYAISKSAAEQYAGWLRKANRLEWLTVVRLYYAYGPGDSETRLVPRIYAHTRSGGRNPFRVTAPEDSLIDPLYVADVAGALVSAAEGAVRDRTLDLCGGEPLRVSEFARRVLRGLGSDQDITVAPDPSELSIQYWSDPSEAIRDLGLRKTPLDQGLRLTTYRNQEGQEDPR